MVEENILDYYKVRDIIWAYQARGLEVFHSSMKYEHKVIFHCLGISQKTIIKNFVYRYLF